MCISWPGDMMGAPLSNLGRLIKMPYGCGEQNMISMVPNIYALRYGDAVSGALTPEQTANAIKYMKSGKQGFQKQVVSSCQI